MTRVEKYDRTAYGSVTGFILPLIVGLTFYLFSGKNLSLLEYFRKITDADILTHIISLCVFPNIVLFLIYNRLDMLRATKGVLGITFFWAITVFAIKFFL